MNCLLLSLTHSNYATKGGCYLVKPDRTWLVGVEENYVREAGTSKVETMDSFGKDKGDAPG